MKVFYSYIFITLSFFVLTEQSFHCFLNTQINAEVNLTDNSTCAQIESQEDSHEFLIIGNKFQIIPFIGKTEKIVQDFNFIPQNQDNSIWRPPQTNIIN